MVCSICLEYGHNRNSCFDKTLPQYISYDNDKTKNMKRKNTDYQFTELLVCLLVLGLNPTENITYESIIDFSNQKYNEKKLKCNKDILQKYYNDLNISFIKKTYKLSYLLNFKIENLNFKLIDIDCVYLTGKTYKDFEELVELNKSYIDKKPNSDIYIKLLNKKICGISCKQTKECPCTNKVVELDNVELMNTRERILIENGITKDNYKNKRGKNGEISKIFCNTYCISNIKNDYWKKLENHIINNKHYFIQGVLDSTCQGNYLSYDIYEYDGTDLINTKKRMFNKDECDIKISDIFCWGKTGPRNASKIWFEFLHNDNIIYNLEVRFKGTYFGKGGQPQIFVLKESKKDINSYIEASEKFKSSNL